MSKSIITIGSDPEYAIKDTLYGCQVDACSVQELMINRSQFGEATTDGHRDIGELRPHYAFTVREHIQNIRGLIRGLHRRIEGVPRYKHLKLCGGEWVFENDRNPPRGDGIGGHIHFGLARGDYMSESTRDEIAEALDYWVAPVVMLTEPMPSAQYRRKGDDRFITYGHLGDHRTQSWGVEYRVLGSWLTSPRTAFAVLSYAYCVTDAVIRGQVPPRPSASPMDNVYKAYMALDMQALRRHYSLIKPLWRQFPAAHDRDVASGMGTLASLINLGHRWRESDDLRKHWLPQEFTPAPEEFSPAQLARVPGRGAAPVLWPGPGMPGHGIFSTVFHGGHRFLIFKQYQVLLGVYTFPRSECNVDIITKHDDYSVQGHFPDARVRDGLGTSARSLETRAIQQSGLQPNDGNMFILFCTHYLDDIMRTVPHWADWLYKRIKATIRSLGASSITHQLRDASSLEAVLNLNAAFYPNNATAFEELSGWIHPETLDRFVWHYTQLPEEEQW